VGVLVVGWTKGGKTETLLSFANHGASYVADEWVLLAGDGQRMLGLPIPVTLWDWQLEHVAPDLLPRIGLGRRARFSGIHLLEAVHRAFARGRAKRTFPVRALDRLLPLLRAGLNVRALPRTMFQDRFCDRGATVDRVFLVVSHSEPDLVVVPCDPIEIARRMVNSNEHEETEFTAYYRAFKYAFPQWANEFLEEAPSLQRTLLTRALSGKKAYAVFHPYPVSFEALFERMGPYCGKDSDQ
jgi:hypothetical protein